MDQIVVLGLRAWVYVERRGCGSSEEDAVCYMVVKKRQSRSCNWATRCDAGAMRHASNKLGGEWGEEGGERRVCEQRGTTIQTTSDDRRAHVVLYF